MANTINEKAALQSFIAALERNYDNKCVEANTLRAVCEDYTERLVSYEVHLRVWQFTAAFFFISTVALAIRLLA